MLAIKTIAPSETVMNTSLKHLFPYLLAIVPLVMSSCSKEPDRTPSIRIVPRIASRVTALNFEAGDCIGLNIVRPSGTYATNEPFTYDGTAFTSASLTWYADASEGATLTAYYPYDASGCPGRFTVAADQSAGTTASDLLGAVAREVTPTTSAVPMLFHHLLSRLRLELSNASGSAVRRLELSGTIATAVIDLEACTATPAAGETPATITPGLLPDEKYEAILVPQEGNMTVRVETASGKQYERTVPMLLQGGKSYRMTVELTAERLNLSLSGEIADWTDGGDPTVEPQEPTTEDPTPAPQPAEEMLTIGGEQYALRTIAGTTWMAENLRTLPEGATLENGVWSPSSNGAAAPDQVGTLGYLYDGATAASLCPTGWHLPTAEELQALVGADTGSDFFVEAGFWRASTSGMPGYGEKSYLLGAPSTTMAGNSSVLLYTASGAQECKELSSTFGFTVRYVRDR